MPKGKNCTCRIGFACKFFLNVSHCKSHYAWFFHFWQFTDISCLLKDYEDIWKHSFIGSWTHCVSPTNCRTQFRTWDTIRWKSNWLDPFIQFGWFWKSFKFHCYFLFPHYKSLIVISHYKLFFLFKKLYLRRAMSNESEFLDFFLLLIEPWLELIICVW